MKLWCAGALLLAAATLIGCQGESSRSGRPRVKIGVEGPFEGTNSHIGEIILNSVTLQFRNHPIPDLDVQLVPIDDKSNPPDAVAALQASVPDPQLVAIIGFYNSSTALAGKPIIQEAKVPTIIYSASNPAVTEQAPYYFRVVPTDDSQSVVLADFARELGATRIAVLYHADEYGKGLADGIEARLKGVEGMTIVSTQSYDASTSDFRPLLTVEKAAKPDVVFVCGFVEKSIAILNQAAEKGLNATFILGDGSFNEEQLIQGAGRNAEGVYVAAPYLFDAGNPKNQEFLDAYWAAYPAQGARHTPASWSAFAYDSAAIIRLALTAGHRDRQSIGQFLRGMHSKETGYDGVTGLTYFNPRGDAVGRLYRLARVRNGAFVLSK